jgi:glycosyltransferase involved in cell wall biosynthesis
MGRSLRIVFVAPFGIRHKSTVWARTLPLAREMNRLGHSASILVPPWDSPQDSGKLIIHNGVMLEHVALSGGLPAAVSRLLLRIRTESPDIVHIVKPRAHAGIIQWLLWQARRSCVDSPLTLLDIDDWERPWAAINRYPRYQAQFLKWQEEWGIRHADGITAASRWLVDKANQANPAAPILYLPNGVDPQSSTITRSYSLRHPPRILLISRFMEVTPAWLAEFWRALRLEVDEAVLIVAGKALHAGGETPYLMSLAEGGGGKRWANLVWLGYVHPNDLPDLYRWVDCAIFPSQNTALHRAKCSLRLATALQHGVPAIASAVGEQAGYGAGGAAHVTSPDSTPAEFAHAVAEVLKSEEYRRHLGQTATARMDSEYAWPSLAKQLDQFYRLLTSDA